jgi:hypothetical protein
MRAVLLLAASMTVLYTCAAAQTDQIGLYIDAGYTECKLADDSPGEVTVYIVHHSSSGALASQFMIQASSGSALTYVGEDINGLSLGNTQSGLAISYQLCRYGDILAGTVRYFKTGTSSTCSSLLVVPDPASVNGKIEAMDCFEGRVDLGGTRLVINPDGTCECGPTSEITSWGKIKGRFRK